MLLIIDLESTCWDGSVLPNGERQGVDNMEIIEIGCAVASREGELLDSRSFLVRPQEFPELSEFCVKLTGITQAMVDEASTFAETIGKLNEWLRDFPADIIWCSWGNYDRLHMESQSMRTGASPLILEWPHLNLKRIWRRTTGQKKKNSLGQALAFHDLTFQGTPHRGIDDARNIVRLLPFVDWNLLNQIVAYRKPSISKTY